MAQDFQDFIDRSEQMQRAEFTRKKNEATYKQKRFLKALGHKSVRVA